MTKLSIVIPVYFNEQNLIPLYEDLNQKVLSQLDCDYEIVFVDDGSEDNSFEKICELQERDSHIQAIQLSRNFGSHAAILAGFSHCTGECATIKAADLQEPSELILEMYESWKKGNNVVLAVRKDREEPLSQKLFSNVYYTMMRRFILPDMPEGGFDCCLIDRKVIDTLSLMDEKNTSIMGQILWCGFKRDMVYYIRKKREIGKSRWTLKKKINLVFDSLFGFSYLPIKLLSGIGIIFFCISVVWGLIILFSKLLGGIETNGWTTLMIVILLASGLILLGLGIIGEYLWRTFDAARQRPPYIIERFIKKNGEEGNNK